MDCITAFHILSGNAEMLSCSVSRHTVDEFSDESVIGFNNRLDIEFMFSRFTGRFIVSPSGDEYFELIEFIQYLSFR